MGKTFDFSGKWGIEVRNHYNLLSQQQMDGSVLTPEDISIRSMNFGQHWRTEGIRNFPYQVSIPLNYVIDYLNTQLPEYIEDAFADRDEEDELDNLLMAYGWSKDAKTLLLETNNTLRDLLLDFFAFDILLHWYSDGPVSDGGAIINTHDQFSIEGDYLIITGVCRKSGVPVRYQDA